jgi:hypothetical protein
MTGAQAGPPPIEPMVAGRHGSASYFLNASLTFSPASLRLAFA